jgi:hypothetical protein
MMERREEGATFFPVPGAADRMSAPMPPDCDVESDLRPTPSDIRESSSDEFRSAAEMGPSVVRRILTM